MFAFKSAVGLIVNVSPEMVICPSLIGMTRTSLEPLEMVTLPVPATIYSLNVSTMLLLKATLVALRAGVLLDKVGAIFGVANCGLAGVAVNP